MATWKKVIVSGSIASLAEVSASVGFKGSLAGNATTATTATQVGNSLTVDDSTIQLNSGTTYDGAAARTISIKDDGVTYAKIQNVSATNRILGRDSAGAGVIEEITPANLRTMINVADGANAFSLTAAGIRGVGAGIVSGSTQIAAAGALMDSEVTNLAFVKALASGINEGQVLIAGGTQIVDNDFLRINGTDVEGRTASELASDIGALTNAAGISGLGAGIVSSSAQVSALGGVQDSTITVTAGDGLSGGGSFTTNTGSNGTISLAVGVDDSTIELNSDALRIKDSGVTLAKLANIADTTILGNNAGSAGAPIALTPAQVRTEINVEDGADVTDTTNVTSAGALMDSEVTNLAFVKALASGISETNVLVADATIEDDDFLRINGTSVEGLDKAAMLTALNLEDGADVTDTTNVTAAGALMDSELTSLSDVKAINQGLTTTSNVDFNNVVVAGNLTVSGTRTEINVANLNVEDQFILVNSGSTAKDAGIVFGGTSGTAQQGKAIMWDYSYNGNDGRLAVSTTDVTHNSTSNFAAGTTGHYLAGVYEGTAANAATAKADHPGNIRIESSEIYIYV